MSEPVKGGVIVDDQPGASGLFAADSVGKAAPDRYAVLMAPTQIAACRAGHPGNPVDPDQDLEPAGIVAVRSSGRQVVRS